MLPTISVAVPQYTITDLGTLGGHQSSATGINESGQVIGYANVDQNSNDYHAFVWESGLMRALDTLGTRGSTPLGINDYGQMVGYVSTPSGPRAVLWNPAGAGQILASQGAAVNTTAYGINNNGQIVGSQYADPEARNQAILWPGIGGAPVDLGTIGGNISTASAINDSGLVVGWATDSPSSGGQLLTLRAFAWTAIDGMTNLVSRGVGCCTAEDVNNLGQIVGYDATRKRGYFLDTAGSAVFTDALESSGLTGLSAINNLGQAVGHSSFADTSHAVLWTEASGLLDLNTTIVDLSGWSHIQAATGINDKGQIVGYGQTIGGGTHAFLLTPVPVPGAVWLFGSALGVMGWMRRRSMAVSRLRIGHGIFRLLSPR
jgi:probable HAF family extracellular repeat protein